MKFLLRRLRGDIVYKAQSKIFVSLTRYEIVEDEEGALEKLYEVANGWS
jgi:hypothetical protein